MKSEPVGLIEMFKFVVNATITWVVVMGFWQLTEVQQAQTLTLALAIVSLVGAYWQRSQVTPIENPKDNAGAPLVRADGRPISDD